MVVLSGFHYEASKTQILSDCMILYAYFKQPWLYMGHMSNNGTWGCGLPFHNISWDSSQQNMPEHEDLIGPAMNPPARLQSFNKQTNPKLTNGPQWF